MAPGSEEPMFKSSLTMLDHSPSAPSGGRVSASPGELLPYRYWDWFSCKVNARLGHKFMLEESDQLPSGAFGATQSATVHRFGVQSRQPRALPSGLVDCPPCTFVDRKEKRQLRGRRHYIHGS